MRITELSLNNIRINFDNGNGTQLYVVEEGIYISASEKICTVLSCKTIQTKLFVYDSYESCEYTIASIDPLNLQMEVTFDENNMLFETTQLNVDHIAINLDTDAIVLLSSFELNNSTSAHLQRKFLFAPPLWLYRFPKNSSLNIASITLQTSFVSVDLKNISGSFNRKLVSPEIEQRWWMKDHAFTYGVPLVTFKLGFDQLLCSPMSNQLVPLSESSVTDFNFLTWESFTAKMIWDWRQALSHERELGPSVTLNTSTNPISFRTTPSLFSAVEAFLDASERIQCAFEENESVSSETHSPQSKRSSGSFRIANKPYNFVEFLNDISLFASIDLTSPISATVFDDQLQFELLHISMSGIHFEMNRTQSDGPYQSTLSLSLFDITFPELNGTKSLPSMDALMLVSLEVSSVLDPVKAHLSNTISTSEVNLLWTSYCAQHVGKIIDHYFTAFKLLKNRINSNKSKKKYSSRSSLNDIKSPSFKSLLTEIDKDSDRSPLSSMDSPHSNVSLNSITNDGFCKLLHLKVVDNETQTEFGWISKSLSFKFSEKLFEFNIERNEIFTIALIKEQLERGSVIDVRDFKICQRQKNQLELQTQPFIVDLSSTQVMKLIESIANNKKLLNENLSILYLEIEDPFEMLKSHSMNSFSSSYKTKFSLNVKDFQVNLNFTPTARIGFHMSNLESEDAKTHVVCKGVSLQINNQTLLSLKHTRISSKSPLSGFERMHNRVSQEISVLEVDQEYHTSKSSFSEFPFSLESDILMKTEELNINFPNKFPLGSVVDQINCVATVCYDTINDTFQVSELFTMEGPVKLPQVHLHMIKNQIKFEDHHFEHSLGFQQQLWPQEWKTRQEREEILFTQMDKKHIDHKRRKKMIKQLEAENSRLYLQKMLEAKKQQKDSPGIFTISVDTVEINLSIPESMTTRQGMVDFIERVDDAPLPSPDPKYCQLMGIEFSGIISNFKLNIKEYPMPMLRALQIAGSGKAVLGQLEGSFENTISRTVNLGHDFQPKIQSTISPVKAFYDLNGKFESVEMAIGTCYLPAFTDMNIASELLTPPSLDPSDKLEWWDLVRYRLHGKFQVDVTDITVCLIIGNNPYEPTDHLEISVDHLNGRYRTGNYSAEIKRLAAKPHPSLSYFPHIVEFPYVAFDLDFSWVTKQDNPHDHYLPLCLPNEFRTEEGIKKYKNQISYDTFSNFRSEEMDALLKVEVLPDATKTCNQSSPCVMFDPLSTSWFIDFVQFMRKIPLPIELGTVHRYGMKPLSTKDVMDIMRSFPLYITAKDLQLIWSNGIAASEILHVSIDDFLFNGWLFQDELPDTNIIKSLRKEKDMIPVAMRFSVEGAKARIYQYNESQDSSAEALANMALTDNIFLSVDQINFYYNILDHFNPRPLPHDYSKVVNSISDLNIEVGERILNTISSFESQLLVSDPRIVWSPSIRDAIFTWVDIYQQFDFNEHEVVQRRTLRHIASGMKPPEKQNEGETESRIPHRSSVPDGHELLEHLLNTRKKRGESMIETKGTDSRTNKMFVAQVLNAQVIMFAEETDECFIFQSTDGHAEIMETSFYERVGKDHDYVHNKQTEVIALLSDVQGYIADVCHGCAIDEYWISELQTNQKQIDINLQRVVEPSPWSGSFTQNQKVSENKPLDILNINIPFLEMVFSSSQLQTLIDIIQNSIIPKKLPRAVLVEDKLDTYKYKSKLAPEVWGNVQQLQRTCEQLRKELRRLDSSLNAARREAAVNVTENIAKKIVSLEHIIRKKKIEYHGMSDSLRELVNQAEEEADVVAHPKRETRININTCNWRMIDPFSRTFMIADLTGFNGSILEYTDYSILHNFRLHTLHLHNRLPSPVYDTILGPFLEDDDVFGDRDNMLRIYAKTIRPVAGITGYEHFEIDIYPLNVHLTYEVYRYLWNYFFPLSKVAPEEKYEIQKPPNPQELLSMYNDRKRISTNVFSYSIDDNNKKKSKRLKDVDLMKERAKNNKIFNYVKLDEVMIMVSFVGTRDLGISNFEDCRVRLKPVVYHSQVWTWEEFFEILKMDILKQTLSTALPGTFTEITANKFKRAFTSLTRRRNDDEEEEIDPALMQGNKTGKYLRKKKYLDQLQSQVRDSGSEVTKDNLKQMLLFGKLRDKKDKVDKLLGSRRSQSFVQGQSINELSHHSNNNNQNNNNESANSNVNNVRSQTDSKHLDPSLDVEYNNDSVQEWLKPTKRTPVVMLDSESESTSTTESSSSDLLSELMQN